MQAKHTRLVNPLGFPSFSNQSALEHQVKVAIYVTNLILLKYFNLFDTDHNRSTPHDKVLFIPAQERSILNDSTNVSPSSTPRHQFGGSKLNDELILKQSIMTFHSIVFTRTMVERFPLHHRDFSEFELYQIPKLRSKNKKLDGILSDSVASNLLRKFNHGVSPTNSRSDLYVKCLPMSLAENTTNA